MAPFAAITTADPAELWSEAKLKEAIQVWNVSPQDEKKLRALQVKFQRDYGPHLWNDPHVVLAFAEAHGFCQTERRFRKMMDWRKRNKIDALLETYVPHPLLLDNSPVAFLKEYDNDGDPIYVERGGACDAKGLLKRFSKEQILTHSIWLREVQSNGVWMDEYEQRQGRPAKDITVIYDLKGLCGRHLHPTVISFFQKLMDITDNYYPGPVKRVIVIRSPHIFRHVWAVVQHFFSEEARQKMIFAKSDYLTELAKYMDINVLPPCLNPNGTGETAVGMPKRMEGGKIPSHIGKGGAGYVSPYANTSGISQYKAVQEPVPGIDEACSSTASDDSEEDEEEETKTTIRKGSVDVVETPCSQTVAATC